MGGFHPEEAVSRWRASIQAARTPRDEMNACIDAVRALTAAVARRQGDFAADAVRQEVAAALRAVFEEHATPLEPPATPDHPHTALSR